MSVLFYVVFASLTILYLQTSGGPSPVAGVSVLHQREKREDKTCMVNGTLFTLADIKFSAELRERCKLALDLGIEGLFCLHGNSVFVPGDYWTSGRYRYICSDTTNIEVTGCTLPNEDGLAVGEEFTEGNYTYKCENENGTVLFKSEKCKIANCNKEAEVITMGQRPLAEFGISKSSESYFIYCRFRHEVKLVGEIWDKNNVRYRCQETGLVEPIGCITYQKLGLSINDSFVMDNMLHSCVQKYGHVVYKSTECSPETPCTSEEAQSSLNSNQGSSSLSSSSHENVLGCITDEGYEMSVGEVKVLCNVKHSCLKSEYGLIYVRKPCGGTTNCSGFDSDNDFNENENLL